MPNSKWQVSRLGDLVEHQKGFAFKSTEYVASGHPIARVSNFTEQSVDMTDCNYIDPALVNKYSDFILRTGDVVIATVGSWPNNPASVVGKAIFVPQEADGALLNQNSVRLRTSGFIGQRFLFYLLRTEEFQNYILGTARGSANQSSIALKDIFNFEFLLPPLSEQHAIACILGALDDKIELNRRMNRTLEEMAQAIFKSWFVDFDPVTACGGGRPTAPTEIEALFPSAFQDSELGPIPKGWQVGKISDICTTQYGYTASASSVAIGPKFLRITDMNKEPWIDWGNVPFCAIDDRTLPKYRLQIGDVLVSRMADPGKAAIVEESVDAVFASYLVRLKTNTLAWSYFLFYFLRSDQYLDYANGAMGGSVQAGMNAQVIVGADMVLPSNDVVGAFLKAIHPLRTKIANNLQQARTLAAIRDALLPRLLAGEIRVRQVEKFAEQVA